MSTRSGPATATDTAPVACLPAAARDRPGAMQWLYLLYLANLAWQPLFDPTASWVDWAIAAGIIALFVPLFVLSFRRRERSASTALVATVVLGFAATLVNVGASVLFVYAAAMVAERERKHALRWNVGMTFLLFLLAAISPVPYPYRLWGVLPSLAFLWIVALQTQSEVAQRTESERLRIESVRTGELATAAERERIARDLHDLLGQSLTSLVVRAQLIQTLATADPGAVAAQAQQLEESARTGLEQVRTAVSGLHELALDDEVETARRTLAAAGIDATVHVPAEVVPSPLVERSLALALREAVTNVVRHAGAAACTISVVRADELWRLEVTDDGRGGDAPEGNGLRGMRERIAAVGGRVELLAGRGTSVVVTVPA